MMFVLSFTGGMVMLVLGFVRLTVNNIAALYKHDGKTKYRKGKDKSIGKHFAITAALFVIAALTQFA